MMSRSSQMYFLFKCQIVWNYNANLSINLVVKQDAFSNIFFSCLLRCSLVYYTQPPSVHCVCEQLCPWQDCADVQAHLSFRWPHVREVTSHELTRFVKHDAEACKNQFKS